MTLRIEEKHALVIRRALEVAQIKAALDGKHLQVVAYEDALDELKRAQIADLPDRSGTIRCDLTLEELKDLQTAVSGYMSAYAFTLGTMKGGQIVRDRLGNIMTRLAT